jgi:threonine/homoserine/homoserine lactone efflux protein
MLCGFFHMVASMSPGRREGVMTISGHSLKDLSFLMTALNAGASWASAAHGRWL